MDEEVIEDDLEMKVECEGPNCKIDFLSSENVFEPLVSFAEDPLETKVKLEDNESESFEKEVTKRACPKMFKARVLLER